MNCNFCKQNIPANSQYCPKCGQSLTSNANASYSYNNKSDGEPLLTNPSDISSPNNFQPQLAVGAELLHYRIDALLGQGKSSTVYKAFNLQLQQTIAIKAVASFEQQHPLLQVYIDEHLSQRVIEDRKHILHCEAPIMCKHTDDLTWLMLPMELANESLRDWMSRYPIDNDNRLEQGMELFRQACSGVEAIHKKGLVHLDIKPENILLTGDADNPIVKITDFGIARSMNEVSQREELFTDGIGTPAYMAPEQIRAAHWKNIGPQADIYALGMILYELIDGDLPYSGTAKDIKEKKLDRSLDIRIPSGPEKLINAVETCINHSSQNRPESIEKLLSIIDGESKINDIVSDENKKTDKKLWYYDEVLLESEKSEMALRYPQFKLGKLDDNRLFWHGKITSIELRKQWYLQVVYDYSYGNSTQNSKSIKVYTIEPDLDEIVNELGSIPFIAIDSNDFNYIDVSDSNLVNKDEFNAAIYLSRAEKWITLFENWLEDKIETEDFLIGL